MMVMEKLVAQLKDYNVVAREVGNKIYIMVESRPGEFVFPILDQPQSRELVKLLNLDIQV